MIILFFLVSILACTANNQTVDRENDIAIPIVKKKIEKDSFDILFHTQELENNEFELMVTVELHEGDYIISPFSEDDFYGKFNLSVSDSTNILWDDVIVENPVSIEEIDSFIQKPVKFVRETTNYMYKFKLKNQADFSTNGLIWLLLEPSCVPYEVDFILSKNGDKITAQKVGIRNVLPGKKNVPFR